VYSQPLPYVQGNGDVDKQVVSAEVVAFCISKLSSKVWRGRWRGG